MIFRLFVSSIHKKEENGEGGIKKKKCKVNLSEIKHPQLNWFSITISMVIFNISQASDLNSYIVAVVVVTDVFFLVFGY